MRPQVMFRVSVVELVFVDRLHYQEHGYVSSYRVQVHIGNSPNFWLDAFHGQGWWLNTAYLDPLYKYAYPNKDIPKMKGDDRTEYRRELERQIIKAIKDFKLSAS